VKRIGVLLLTSVLMLVLMTFTGCRKYMDVRIVSVKVESVNMKGLRAGEAVLSVRVDNPAGKMTLEELNGVVKHSGKVLGNIALDPVTLKPRQTDDYSMNVRFELDKGVGVMYMLTFTDIRKLKECTIDLSARGKAAGVKVKREYKDIPVKNLLEEYYNEKI
jgi:hypothetical protein